MLPQWVGAGRLDLSAPTRFLGPRRLIKEGQLSKAKGSKRLTCILTNDILVLTEPSRNLYRMPLPLGEFVLKFVCPFSPSTLSVHDSRAKQGVRQLADHVPDPAPLSRRSDRAARVVSQGGARMVRTTVSLRLPHAPG